MSEAETDPIPEEEQVQEDLFEEEQQQSEPEPQISEAEKLARSNGWLPKDEFTGDEADWRDFHEFNRHGELIGALREARASERRARQAAEESLARNNQFHEQQNKVLRGQIEGLQSQLKEAIRDGDVESATAIQQSIDTTREAIQEPVETTTHNMDEAQAIIGEWNAKNAWIDEDTPKAAYAKAQFTRFIQDNSTTFNGTPTQMIERAIAHVDASVEKEFSEQQTNPNRERSGKYVRGRTAQRASKAPSLTMNDLTREEMGVWQAQSGSYKDEAEFLSVVADARKGVDQ